MFPVHVSLPTVPNTGSASFGTFRQHTRDSSHLEAAQKIQEVGIVCKRQRARTMHIQAYWSSVRYVRILVVAIPHEMVQFDRKNIILLSLNQPRTAIQITKKNIILLSLNAVCQCQPTTFFIGPLYGSISRTLEF
jgi:hypothetical protein